MTNNPVKFSGLNLETQDLTKTTCATFSDKFHAGQAE
jgi:hypothetical protein